MGEISWNLAMSSMEKQKTIRDKWAPLNLMKEKSLGYSFFGNHPYQFTKAAGCIPISIIEEIPEGKESTSHIVDHRNLNFIHKSHKRVQFLSELKLNTKLQNIQIHLPLKKVELLK